MPYRDDLCAAVSRADQLEQELRELRKEDNQHMSQLEAQVTYLKRQLEKNLQTTGKEHSTSAGERPAPTKMDTMGWMIWLLSLLIFLGFVLAISR